jgi:hypothetical protein
MAWRLFKHMDSFACNFVKKDERNFNNITKWKVKNVSGVDAEVRNENDDSHHHHISQLGGEGMRKTVNG